MTLNNYLKASLFDFIICLVAAAALGFVNCGAFYVSDALHWNFAAIIVTSALPLIILFYAAYSRKTIYTGAAVLAIGLAVACGVAAAASGAESVFQDVEANPAIFIFVVVDGSIATFLLTRTRLLARIYAVAAVLDVCWVEFMYKQGYYIALLILLVAVCVMVIYRNYRANLKDASTDKVSFGAATAVASVYAVAILAISCLLFFVLIVPLNPGALEFKPFQRLMNYEAIQMTGVGDVTQVDDPNNLTNQTNENMNQTDQNNQNEADPNKGDETQQNPSFSEFIGSQPITGAGLNLLREMFNFVLENPVTAFAWLLAFVVLVVVLPVVVKKQLRARWFKKTCELPPNEAVERFFVFFMRRFKLLKITKPDQATLAEFAVMSQGPLAEFAQNEQGITFAHIIAMYCASVYGHVPLGQEEVGYCKSFYSTFYKAFKQKSGAFWYAVRFFRV